MSNAVSGSVLGRLSRWAAAVPVALAVLSGCGSGEPSAASPAAAPNSTVAIPLAAVCSALP
ncbi:hypothetical protein AB0L05_30375, partial [Nonomuraea pusilla]